MVKNKTRRVEDWDEKKKIVKDILGVQTDEELWEQIVGERGPIDLIIAAARHWKDSSPSKYGYVFNKLATQLGCSVTGPLIIRASISEFIEMLPEPERALALQSAKQHEIPISSAQSKELVATQKALAAGRIVGLSKTTEQQSIKSGLRAGIIDTSHYYLDTDSAETWQNLVSDEEYPTYDQCRAGLRRLMDDEGWAEAIRRASPRMAVMLAGGGSPTKDRVLLKHLRELPENDGQLVRMLLVDVSYYMLEQSMRVLDRIEQNCGNVEIKYFRGDVLDLRQLASHPMFQRDGSIVFAITGGTIGNLRERRFFQSLDLIAQSGDLLIVSADTVDGMPDDELKSQLTKKYKHASMQRMIKPGVMAVVSELASDETLNSALQRLEVRVQRNEVLKLSDVPESWNLALVITAADREITLVSSTRYSVTALQEFAKNVGWESICNVSSPENEHFVQFAFRRK